MTITHFSTPEEAQNAFYQAIERADLAQMMAVWAEDEDILCVHPGGERHTGIDQVRESWRQIFANGPELKFKLHSNHSHSGRMLSVHSVYEQITHTRGKFAPSTVVATNIFVLSNRGWRLLLHHASTAPQGSVKEAAPSILH